MVELGYALSSEEHSPRGLVRHAVAAERAGSAGRIGDALVAATVAAV